VNQISRLLVKLGTSLVTLWGVLTIVFLASHAGSNPVRQLVPLNASPAEVNSVTQFLGLNKPLVVQYMTFLGHAVQGNFGNSYFYQRPALPFVLSLVPPTLLLVSVAVGGAVIVSFAAAFTAAIHPGGRVDRLFSAVAGVSLAIPSFWLGTLLIIVFAVDVRMFPVAGDQSPKSIVLPAITLGLFQLGVYFAIIRAASIEVLGSDFARLVQSKGVSRRRLISDHVLRNVSLTALTIVGLTFGATLGGTVIVEVIFAWPGIGNLLVESADRYDFPVLESCVLVIGAAFIIVNMVVDALYGVINPQTAAASRDYVQLPAVNRTA